MKKLMCAAVAAVSMVAMAKESATAKSAEAAKPATAAVEAAKPAAKSFKMTDEQRQKMREQREKFMAERKAKMEAQLLEVVKKYVPEEEKAKALVKELQDAMMAGRRNMMQRRPKKSEAGKPAETK